MLNVRVFTILFLLAGSETLFQSAHAITPSEVELRLRIETLYAEYLNKNGSESLPIDSQALTLAKEHASLLEKHFQSKADNISVDLEKVILKYYETFQIQFQQKKKLYGVAPIIAMMSAEVVQKTISLWAFMTGNFYINAFTGVCPITGEAALFTAYSIQCMMTEKRLHKLYGGKSKYQQVMQRFSEMKKSLAKEGTILLSPLLLNESTYFVKISFPSFMEKVSTFFYIKPKTSGITWKELKAFFRSWNFTPNLVDEIDRASSPNTLKTFMALQILSKLGPQSLIADFKLKFSQTLIPTKVDTLAAQEKQNFLDWIDRALSSPTLESLSDTLSDPPPATELELVARTIDEIILPALSSRHDLMTYPQYRKIIDLGKYLAGFHSLGWSRAQIVDEVAKIFRQVMQLQSCENALQATTR